MTLIFYFFFTAKVVDTVAIRKIFTAKETQGPVNLKITALRHYFFFL